MDSAAGDVPLLDVLNLLKEASMPLATAAVGATAGAILGAEAPASVEAGAGAPSSSSSSVAGGLLSVMGVLAGTAVTILKMRARGGAGSETDPDVKRGKLLIEQGKYAEAVEAFNDAIEKNDRHANAYNNRAVAFFYLGMYPMCVTDCDTQISISPESAAQPLSNKAMALEKLGQTDAAAEAWSLAIEQSDPAQPHLYTNRGQLYIRLGEFQLALDDFTKALDLERSADALAGKADVTIRLGGDLSTALKEIQEAVELSPTCSEFYCILGRAYATIDSSTSDRALEAFTAAITHDTQNCEAYMNRAYILRELGQTESALRDLQMAAKADDKNMVCSAHVAMADIISADAADLSAHMQAILEVNKALDKDDKHWPAYTSRGTIYHRLGRRREAIDDFTKALQLIVDLGGEDSPEYAGVLENLKAVSS